MYRLSVHVLFTKDNNGVSFDILSFEVSRDLRGGKRKGEHASHVVAIKLVHQKSLVMNPERRTYRLLSTATPRCRNFAIPRRPSIFDESDFNKIKGLIALPQATLRTPKFAICSVNPCMGCPQQLGPDILL